MYSVTDFSWFEGKRLEDIVTSRLKREIGPKLKYLESPEEILEQWARESGRTKEFSRAIANILEKDYADCNEDYYRGLFCMVQRLCLKDAYPKIRKWFEKNYNILLKRKNVGDYALYALASTQTCEEHTFWEKLLVVGPTEWVFSAYSGLIICSLRAAVDSLSVVYTTLSITKEKRWYGILVRRLYNYIIYSGKRSSKLDELYLVTRIRQGVASGKDWALEAKNIIEQYLEGDSHHNSSTYFE